MKLLRYWAVAEMQATDRTGKKLRLRKWAGSNDGKDAADRAARQALDALARRVNDNGIDAPADDYAYGARDIPEELIRMIGDKSGLTRNRYGCAVLNTQEVLFADIDLPAPGIFGRLFGQTRAKAQMRALETLSAWLERNPSARVRVYQTAAGLRYLFTHAKIGVTPESLRTLQELGSDKLYTTLCRRQECFRARLEPKPWRINVPRPSVRFPYDTTDKQAAFDDWHAAFRAQAEKYAVCAYLDTQGNGYADKTLDPLIELHDDMTRSQETLPLA